MLFLTGNSETMLKTSETRTDDLNKRIEQHGIKIVNRQLKYSVASRGTLSFMHKSR